MALLRVLLAGSAVAALSGLGAAMDNGLARLPPMGWRSWNAYGGGVNQTKMMLAMDRMVARTRPVGPSGRLTSLLDLGYRQVGLDDGWQREWAQ